MSKPRRPILFLCLALALTACVPFGRLGFGRPTSERLEAFVEKALEQAGSTIIACPPALAEDSKYRHVCARAVSPYQRFRTAWEAALTASIEDAEARLETLYGGWRESDSGVFVNFYAINGRRFNLVYAPDPTGASVILAIDQVGN